MIYIYVYFSSIFIGITTFIWFGVLYLPVRRLRQGAKWLDKLDVEIPGKENPLLVKNFRKHEENGDKIVITHYLNNWTKEIESTITENLIYGALIAGVINIATVVYSNQAKLALDNIPDAVKDIILKLPIPAFFLYTALQIITFLRLVHKQSSKYSDIIKNAKPKGLTFRERKKKFIETLLR